MSFAKHTSDPPPFDATAANNAFLKRLLKDDGSPFQVFLGGGFQKLNRWLLGIGEYDGIGLKDVVEANADGLDSIKSHVDLNSGKLLDLEDRVAALEAQPAPRPFP